MAERCSRSAAGYTGSSSGQSSSCCWGGESWQRDRLTAAAETECRGFTEDATTACLSYAVTVRAHKSTHTHTDAASSVHNLPQFKRFVKWLWPSHTHLYVYMQSVGNVYSMHTDTHTIYKHIQLNMHTMFLYVHTCTQCTHTPPHMEKDTLTHNIQQRSGSSAVCETNTSAERTGW